MQSSPLSLPLTLFHWILFLEAIYCFGFIGFAYGLGEGFSAVLDIAIRVLLFKEGWKAAALLIRLPYFCHRALCRQTKTDAIPLESVTTSLLLSD